MSGNETNSDIRTGEPATQEISDELMKAAEIHAQQLISDMNEEKEKHRKALIRLGVMLSLVVLVLVFAAVTFITS